MEIIDLISYGKNIVFGDYGPAWKLQRKIAHSALRVYGSSQGILEEKVAEEVRFLQIFSDNNNNNNNNNNNYYYYYYYYNNSNNNKMNNMTKL